MIMAEAFRLGIAGLGTVGVGVVKNIQQHGDLLAARCGRRVEITTVSARDSSKDRGVDLSAYDWVDNAEDLANSNSIDCVVEMIGGSEGLALNLVRNSLSKGKHVITANKALLAHHGAELAKLAEDNNVSLAYEAAIAGGVPIVKAFIILHVSTTPTVPITFAGVVVVVIAVITRTTVIVALIFRFKTIG